MSTPTAELARAWTSGYRAAESGNRCIWFHGCKREMWMEGHKYGLERRKDGGSTSKAVITGSNPVEATKQTEWTEEEIEEWQAPIGR